MSVDIAGGPLFAKQSEGPQQGLFFSFNDAVINAVIGAADPTNPRIDVVIATFRDSSISGANNDAIIAVVPGTPAGAPVQPNPTTAGYKNYIQLAAVRVDALVTTIVNAKITDLRTMSGTQMAVISATTQYTATPTKGNAVYRATGDVAEGPEFYNGAAWRKPWSMPWGNIGVGSATAIQTPIAALTDLTNLTVSFTAVANRRIRAMIFVKLQQSVDIARFTLSITDGSNSQFASSDYTMAAVNVQQACILIADITSIAAGAFTLKGRVAKGVGTGVGQTAWAATSPNFFAVDDMGPAAGAPS